MRPDTVAYLRNRRQTSGKFVAWPDLLGAVVGAAVGYYTARSIWWAIAGAVASALIVQAAHFVWRFVWVVPREMHLDNLRDIARLEGERNSALAKCREAEQKATAAQGERDAREAEIKELGNFLFTGEQLEREYLGQRGSDQAEHHATEWYNRVSRYLDCRLGRDYAARFKAAMTPALSGIPDGFPAAKTTTLFRIRGRKQCLAEITLELRSKS